MANSRATGSIEAPTVGRREHRREPIRVPLDGDLRLLRAELDRVREAGDELARVLRQVRSWVEWSAEPRKRGRFLRRRKSRDGFRYEIGREARESVLQRYEELLARWESVTPSRD
jgi:hypothetical protein